MYTGTFDARVPLNLRTRLEKSLATQKYPAGVTLSFGPGTEGAVYSWMLRVEGRSFRAVRGILRALEQHVHNTFAADYGALHSVTSTIFCPARPDALYSMYEMPTSD